MPEPLEETTASRQTSEIDSQIDSQTATQTNSPPASQTSSGERLVLARAYRPLCFADLLGQEHARRVIENALRNERLHHAILLSGPRGVGKTTLARLIARAINCKSRKSGIDPCGSCSACQAMAGESLDLVEIDAASHTGVDGVRDIVDGASYRPVILKYRVYIIDEVHMLSRSAFNALLKTLEEPPPHLRFLFATTESDKVPLTVLSRCLRLELRRLDNATLAAHYRNVSEREGKLLEEDAAMVLAQAAEGSVRDGLSLLDCAFSESQDATITLAQVRNMLLLSDGNALYDLLEAIVDEDLALALTRLSSLLDKGGQPEILLREIMERLHRLSRFKVAGAIESSLEPSDRERGKALSERLSLATLARMWQLSLRGYEELRLAPDPSAALDMLVVRLTCAAGMPLPSEVLARLAKDKDITPKDITPKDITPNDIGAGDSSLASELRAAFPNAKIDEQKLEG